MVSDLGQSVAVGPVWGQRREALRGCFLSRPHAPPHLLPTTSANEEQMKRRTNIAWHASNLPVVNLVNHNHPYQNHAHCLIMGMIFKWTDLFSSSGAGRNIGHEGSYPGHLLMICSLRRVSGGVTFPQGAATPATSPAAALSTATSATLKMVVRHLPKVRLHCWLYLWSVTLTLLSTYHCDLI